MANGQNSAIRCKKETRKNVATLAAYFGISQDDVVGFMSTMFATNMEVTIPHPWEAKELINLAHKMEGILVSVDEIEEE